MSTPPMPVYPCLKENSWQGHEDSLCRPLWSGRASEFMPWVAFGYDHPHTFEFLSKAQVKEGPQDANQVEREAVRNLRLRKVEWTEVSVKLSFFKKLKMQVCQGDFLAAEKILDVGFMRQAQTALKARGILVGIPVRGVMFAMDGEGGTDRITAFIALIASQYQSAESAPISPAVFALKDGQVVEMVEVGAQAFAGLVPVAEDEDAADGDEDAEDDGDPNEPYIMGMVVGNPAGLEEVHIMAAGEDSQRLGQAIVNALAQSMSTHLSRPEFSGHVKVVLLAHTPQAVRDELAPLEAHLQGILSEVGGKQRDVPLARPLTVEVTQQTGGLFDAGP